MKRRKLIVAMLLIFISGGLIGFVSGYNHCNTKWRSSIQNRRDSSMMGEHLVERFKHELNLTDKQLDDVKPAFMLFFKKQSAVDKKVIPQKTTNLQELLTAIKSVLTPDQLVKMQRMETRKKEIFNKRLKSEHRRPKGDRLERQPKGPFGKEEPPPRLEFNGPPPPLPSELR